MSIHFDKLTFDNDNNIDLTSLTIETSPGGRVYGPSRVTANTTITINPNVADAESVKLTVESDGDPDTEAQTFSASTGAFITSLDVKYDIGSFEGTVTSSAGKSKAIKTPRKKIKK